MTASSSVVLANLAYLIGAVALAVIAVLIVWLRHRQPRSVDANMASFRKGLSALAPDDPAKAAVRQPQAARIRPAPSSVQLRPPASDPGDDSSG